MDDEPIKAQPSITEAVEVKAVPVSYAQVAPEQDAIGDLEMGALHGRGNNVNAIPQITSDSGYQLPGEPKGRWRDGLCDCMNSVPNCLCTCFCLWQPISQEFEIIMHKNSYFFVAPLMFLIWLTDVASWMFPEEFITYYGIFDVSQLVWLIICTVMLTIIRMNVRAKYNIPPSTCGIPVCEDCCCAFWCTSCVTCQIWRHITSNINERKGCSLGQDPRHGLC